MDPRRKKEDILQLIPRDRLSARQKALRPDVKDISMYQLRHEPTHLEEFDWFARRRVMIWRDNGTVIDVGGSYHKPSRGRKARFAIEKNGIYRLDCTIYGETDAAMADTVTFFCSLQQQPEDVSTSLRFEEYCVACQHAHKVGFVTSLQEEQMIRIFDANPTRLFVITENIFSTEQSVVLATRPYPLKLKLVGDGIPFPDHGTAFVDALQKRQSSFGDLDLEFSDHELLLIRENVMDLLKLDILDKLAITPLDEEFPLLPLSANVNALT